MSKNTPSGRAGADDRELADGGATLTLTPEQLQALGVKKLPDAGARLQLQGMAIVRPLAKRDAGGDADGDAAVDAQGGDGDGDEAGEAAASGASETDGASGTSGMPGNSGAITLHLTALTLTPPRREPAAALYGGGD